MDVNHKHDAVQSAKAGFGAAFGAVFGKFFGCLGVLIVLSLMIAMCSTGKSGDSQPEASPEPTVKPTEVKATEISAAFQANEARAKLAYDGKPLLVTGLVKDIDLSIADTPVIRLRGANDRYGMGVADGGKITDVSIYGLSQQDAASLDKGKTITFMCLGANEAMGSAQLNDCSIQRKDTAKP